MVVDRHHGFVWGVFVGLGSLTLAGIFALSAFVGFVLIALLAFPLLVVTAWAVNRYEWLAIGAAIWVAFWVIARLVLG